MPTRVVIVGGLLAGGNRADLLRLLSERHKDIEWDWVQPINVQFTLPHKIFGRLLHQLRSALAAAREVGTPPDIVVVKLFHLNGKDANSLHATGADPVLAPYELETIEELADWLNSPAAGLVAPTRWELPIRAVALLAVLSKLVRNKSWNKDLHGHMWTKDDDLMGQAPVNRPEHQRLYGEAVGCVGRATNNLLLSKGGSKTPLEWSINIAYLPAVKRAIMARDLAPLRAEASLRDLLAYVDDGPADVVEIDTVIVSEKVLATCRDARADLPAGGAA